MRPLIPILLLAATCVSASAQRFVKVFDNIAALLAANPNDVHTNAYVTGRTIADDGGGGIYTWHSSSTASTNSNLSILKANNFATGRWLRDNGFLLTALTTDRVAVIGADSVLTNGTITLTELNTLTGITGNIQGQIDSIVSGSSNWVDEGDTNATLPGIAKYWKGVVTNSLEIGQPGEAGLITLYSTNGTYAATLTVAADGTFIAGSTVADGDTAFSLTSSNNIGNSYLLTATNNNAMVFGFGAWGGLELYGDNSYVSMQDSVGNFMTFLSPTRSSSQTPYVLDTIHAHDPGTMMLELANFGTNVFTVAAVSGYAGGGTKALFDDGTYKTVTTSGITNINVNPTDGFLPYRSNATVFGDSPFAKGTNSVYAIFGSTVAFQVKSNSLYTGSGTNFLSDNGTYSSGPGLWSQAFSDKAVTRGDITGAYIAESSPGSGVYLCRIFPSISASPGNHSFFMDTATDMGTNGIILLNNATANAFFVRGNSGFSGAGTKALFDDGTYKTAGVSGAQTRVLPLLRFPDSVDGAGCTYANSNDFTARTFMRPRFSAAGATNANFATFSCLVPSDLSTAVDLTATIKVSLVAGDTAASAYTVGMASVANSASSSPTAANYVTLTVPADGSGAAGDVEGVNGVTLTGWRSAMTAGQWLFIQLQRDGSDASATDEDLLALEITYTSTQ